MRRWRLKDEVTHLQRSSPFPSKPCLCHSAETDILLASHYEKKKNGSLHPHEYGY